MTLDKTSQLIPASQFSIETLAAVYNQARADYLVPMLTDADKLAAYIHAYDVDLDHSFVAEDNGRAVGLIMLGVRPGRTWMTRLGVLPGHRRYGLGETLMRALIEETRRLGGSQSFLEVIQGNDAAHALFLKMGFRDIQLLTVMRRAPGECKRHPQGKARWIDAEEALRLLSRYPARLPWTNAIETYRNLGDVQAVKTDLGEGGQGWLVFRHHGNELSHLVFHTQSGNPGTIAVDLSAHLYQRFPGDETYIENLPLDDPRKEALMSLGCQEVFRRIEMRWV